MFMLLILQTKFSLFLNTNAMKTYWWSGGIALHIFNLSTGQVQMVSFILMPLNFWKKAHSVSIEDKMCWPQCYYKHSSAEVES